MCGAVAFTVNCKHLFREVLETPRTKTPHLTPWAKSQDLPRAGETFCFWARFSYYLAKGTCSQASPTCLTNLASLLGFLLTPSHAGFMCPSVRGRGFSDRKSAGALASLSFTVAPSPGPTCRKLQRVMIGSVLCWPGIGSWGIQAVAGIFEGNQYSVRSLTRGFLNQKGSPHRYNIQI